jgi:predicted permease
LFRRGRDEDDLAREIEAHLQLIEDQLIADGMSAGEARPAARRAFGGVEQVKERQRDERSFRWVGNSWLDLKLGARILVKYPGLTLVGGLGMAVAIAIATGTASVVSAMLNPALPLDEGDRLVAMQLWDRAANEPERRILPEFLLWRDQLTSVHDVSAFRQLSRNLIADGGQPETVRLAEMTASGFRLARVSPLLGRHLVDDDERAGAAPVVVIGYDAWRNRFASDPAIVGRAVQLGETIHTVAGVMPQGFGFPVNHGFWVPLRTSGLIDEQANELELFVFGRLAPGATLETAQAELGAVGVRSAAGAAARDVELTPRARPYTYQFSDVDDPANALGLSLTRLVVTLLIVLVAVNVAILVYARTATRHGEIAIRSALGADRRRIVGQLFLEALVLSMASMGVGLAFIAVVLARLDDALVPVFGQLPFWFQLGLSWSAVLYSLGLTGLAAAIVGVVPALKATGQRMQAFLQSLSSRQGSGLQLGKTWTLLVIAQVAFAVAVLPGAIFHAWVTVRAGIASPGAGAREVVTAQLLLDDPSSFSVQRGELAKDAASRYGERHAELMQRLRAEPGLAGVTFALAVPGDEPTVWVEVEGQAMPIESEATAFAIEAGRFGHEARFNRVGVGFFEAFEVPVLTGRTFTAADADAGASAVIVNRSFAQAILGGGNVLGRRLRYVGRSGDAREGHVELERWYEIVGVVTDFPASATTVGPVGAKLYHAAAPGQFYPVTLAARVQGPARPAAGGRVREIAAEVHPNLQLRNVFTMDEILRREQAVTRLFAAVLAVVTLSVVLLSAAGIYSMMSFTVSERRREIGIRAALGADPRRILASIFSRALVQLAAGALLGAVAAVLLERLTRGDLMQGNGPVVVPIVVLVMIGVGALAALGPARRGLRVDPTEALRAG